MPERGHREAVLDRALSNFLDTQVQTGLYATAQEARDAALSLLLARDQPAQPPQANARDLRVRAAALEQQVHDSMDFARLALTAISGVGVWTFEVSTDCFYCDAAIARLYAIDPVQAAAGIKRTAFLANVHPDDLAALRATMSGGLVRSGDLELEYRIVHPDGSVRWVLSRGHTYFDEQGQPVRRTGVGVEMTQQRLLEQQLRQSQKMEAVGQLTGGLAHDFNNLLAAISGSLEMLARRLGQGRLGDLPRYLDAAQGASKRAAALTHRLLAFSRRQPLDPSPTDVQQLIGGMQALIRSTVGPTLDIQVQANPDLWISRVDAHQLENALLNLCINARDALHEGGRITISTANCSVQSDQDLVPGDYVTLTVADNGVGMSADVMAHAFDAFFTTKPLGAGTGLGLSMIYGFVRQSGGQVLLRSQPGEGTTVTLFLPRHEGAVEPLPDAPRAAEQMPAAMARTVLVVDDEPTVRMLVSEVVLELGCNVLQAIDGATGLAVLHSAQPIDLLITDVGLPGGINGRQVADGARARRPGLKVLFITGYAEQAVVGDGHLDPGMHLMTKPFAMEQLAERIKNLLSND